MNRYQSLITQRLNEDGPWGSMSKVMSELDELLKRQFIRNSNYLEDTKSF